MALKNGASERRTLRATRVDQPSVIVPVVMLDLVHATVEVGCDPYPGG